MALSNSSRLDLLRTAARPLTGNPGDLDPLIHLAAAADFVLLGEASHGTHEFYSTRAEITKRLIREEGFQAVAVEADWPDADRVNRYVRARSQEKSATRALSGFTRFPVWMWRNRDVEAFVGWLREYNDSRPAQAVQVGFYGLDLYSLNRSRHEVVRYLEKVDPAGAARARDRYSCFDHFGDNEQAYGEAAAFFLNKSCEDDVVEQLADLQRKSYAYLHRDGQAAEDEFLSAEQNARLVKNAEEYYREMFHGRVNTWNLRDDHMAQTLQALAAHLEKRFGRSKIVVWAHNSHLGNARATDRSQYGEWNLGQLVRERYGRSVLVGFTSYTGTVTAASNWGGPHRTKQVLPALPGSYEALFHEAGIPNFLVMFAGDKSLSQQFRTERLERAIGVIYRPETERASHYFHARLSDQFDAVLHFDETQAVEPLPHAEEEQTSEIPDTYPVGV
jgi:erythromycin esterase-like protein